MNGGFICSSTSPPSGQRRLAAGRADAGVVGRRRRSVSQLVTAARLLLVGCLSGAALLAGCGPEFEPASKLASLRILAVRSDPPEVRPGEAAVLDALVYSPRVGVQASGLALAPAGGAAEAAAAEPPGDDPSGAVEGQPGAIGYSWRACFLEMGLRGTFSSAAGFGSDSSGKSISSCFDLQQVVTVEELLDKLAAGAAGQGSDGGGDPADPMAALGELAIDLGSEPTAALQTLPLPPFPAPGSFCQQLDEADRAEQGGREVWISGIRLTVSLQIDDGSEIVTANKRLVMRPDPAAIPDELQGQPFRTPRLCEAAAADGTCERNVNPLPPQLSTPNGEWDGSGPLELVANQKIKLRPLSPDDQDRQRYVAMRTCGEQTTEQSLARSGGEFERQESRFWAWFADGGEVAHERSILSDEPGDRDSAWRAPAGVEQQGSRFSLVLVARDGRGGVSWSRYELLVSR